jgi:hypothetical protein
MMQSFPFDALDRIGLELALLNVQLCVYLSCKGLSYAARVMFRRDPPTKVIRSKVARSGES